MTDLALFVLGVIVGVILDRRSWRYGIRKAQPELRLTGAASAEGNGSVSIWHPAGLVGKKRGSLERGDVVPRVDIFDVGGHLIDADGTNLGGLFWYTHEGLGGDSTFSYTARRTIKMGDSADLMVFAVHPDRRDQYFRFHPTGDVQTTRTSMLPPDDQLFEGPRNFYVEIWDHANKNLLLTFPVDIRWNGERLTMTTPEGGASL